MRKKAVILIVGWTSCLLLRRELDVWRSGGSVEVLEAIREGRRQRFWGKIMTVRLLKIVNLVT